MANHKLTQEYAEKIFADKGCKLLSEYKDRIKTKLKYLCVCGKIKETTFVNFTNFYSRKDIFECNPLKKQERFNYLKELFEKANCQLISSDYKNGESFIEYICPNGHKTSTKFRIFIQGGGCLPCARKRNEDARKWTFEEARAIIEKDDLYKIVSERPNRFYHGSRIKILCTKCGIVWKKNINDFIKWKGCDHTTKAVSGEKHPYWIKDRVLLKERRKFRQYCSQLVNRVLKLCHQKKTSRSEKILGYSSTDLRNHLYNNCGWLNIKNDSPSIDHIFPIMAFIRYNIFDARLINSLDNLTALPLKDNMSKHDKYDKLSFEKWLTSKGVNFTSQIN